MIPAASALISLLLLAPPTTGPASQPSAPTEFLTDIPPYAGNVILGRPTDRSITLSILASTAASVRVSYGADSSPDHLTAPIQLTPGQPRELLLPDLTPNTAYHYRILDADTRKPLLPSDKPGTFHTARPPGSSFTFDLQADSHLDAGCRPDLYQLTLASIAADHPDFLIDLGDTFMTGKHPSRSSALLQYNAQRYYLGLVSHSAPLFLVLGNHDGEETKKRGASDPDGLATWSCLQRKNFFPNPFPSPPNSFYTGNTAPHPTIGLLHDYYAFTWGDALFIALDPYWTSGPGQRSAKGGRAGGGGAGNNSGWDMTLGKDQYAFLAKTLASSHAKYKFILIHQLVGGLDNAGRGGAEAADFFEWGGHDLDHSDTFAAHRPDFPSPALPVHQLLLKYHVTAVFHGHDHFYAHQLKDGILYQLCPQPAHRNSRSTQAEEYGYKTGTFLPNSGHLRVRVTPANLTLTYIRSATPDLERNALTNGQPADTYSIPSTTN